MKEFLTLRTRDDAWRELKAIHDEIRPEIRRQVRAFRQIWIEGTEEDVFCELVFCLLTPQSSAFRCARALEILRGRDLVLRGSAGEISGELAIVRFRNRKASFIVQARAHFLRHDALMVRETLLSAGDVLARRRWLSSSIKGLGWKEASHFLRNTGFGDDLAILDRHILRNLVRLGVLHGIPSSLNGRHYLRIEEDMRAFSRDIGIPMGDLDFVLWYREAGAVFK
jgi:N-glycosylase/DNA lyase